MADKKVCYLHELYAGVERVVEPEQKEEVLLHGQQLGQLKKRGTVRERINLGWGLNLSL